jgi:hypothetical protein
MAWTEFLWLPAIAISAHLFEEFVWPGGFARWYRQYPPGRTVTVTLRFLVLVNLLFVGLALLPPLLGASAQGLAFWIVVAALAGANAVFHLVAVARTRAYAPGVVTGVALYLPLALVGGFWLVRAKLVSPGTTVQAIIVAAGYHLWSARKHQRGSVSHGAS